MLGGCSRHAIRYWIIYTFYHDPRTLNKVPEALTVSIIPPNTEITNLHLLKPFHSFAEHATFDIGDTVLFKDEADTKGRFDDIRYSGPNVVWLDGYGPPSRGLIHVFLEFVWDVH